MQAFEIKTNKSDYPFLIIANGFKRAIEMLYQKGIYDTDIVSVQQLEAYKSDHILIEERLTSKEVLREEVRRELQKDMPQWMPEPNGAAGGTDRETLVDEGFCYVITKNKGGFYKGENFEGKARNVLHHVRTAFEFEVNEEIMKDFVKMGLWTPSMGLQMNDVAMQEVNGAVQSVMYNFRGEIDTLDNAEAIEGYIYRVHGVFYAYLKGKWRREKNDECWNPITGERKIIADWDMSEED